MFSYAVSIRNRLYFSTLQFSACQQNLQTDNKILVIFSLNFREVHYFCSQKYQESSIFNNLVNMKTTKNSDDVEVVQIIYISMQTTCTLKIFFGKNIKFFMNCTNWKTITNFHLRYGCAQMFKIPQEGFRFLSEEEKEDII